MIDQEQLDKIEKYLKTSITIREPKSKSAFCRSIGITVPTFNKYEVEFRRKGKINRNNGGIPDADDLARQIEVMDNAVYTAGSINKIAKMAELWYRRHNLLVDKSEVKVKISADADELARIDAEAERRARTFREQVGAPSLQERPPLLPAEIREDT
jgi:hypothetical protein